LANVTIKDVAAKAEVSVKTVSRVINNEPNVRQVLQDKVKSAITELGFKRNPLARGLRSQKTFVITFIYTNPNPDYIFEILSGALKQCEKHGYRLQLQPFDHKSETLIDDLNHLVENTNQDGFLITHPLCDLSEIRNIFDNKGIPFTRISPFDDNHHSPVVGSCDTQASTAMTEHLIELGHDKIAYILGDQEFGATHKRFDGFKNAMINAGLSINDNYVIQGDFTFETGEKCARQLLNLKVPPTAIFASNDNTAAAVLKVAAQKKIKVPSELSVAGFDNSPISNQVWPSLTTISQPTEQISKNGVDKLFRAINKKPFDDIESRLTCSIIKRNSTSLAD